MIRYEIIFKIVANISDKRTLSYRLDFKNRFFLRLPNINIDLIQKKDQIMDIVTVIVIDKVIIMDISSIKANDYSYAQ